VAGPGSAKIHPSPAILRLFESLHLRSGGSGSGLNLLALDTSTEYCSVALLRGDELTHREMHAVQRHSELILPMIGELLAASGVDLAGLDGIAFGAGPGSFTGLRIACGVAQGLAFGAGLPVVPVGTLAALAQEAGAPKVIACLDARMGEVYHAAYRLEGGRWSEISAPGVGPAQSAPAVQGAGWFGCGNGFAVYAEALARHYGRQLDGVAAAIHPHARSIARLAAPVLAAGAGLSPEQAAPVYVRDKVALKMHEQR
jgi:tRNA threonylcarbamoyladenosine biosynthesis protein TsaB